MVPPGCRLPPPVPLVLRFRDKDERLVAVRLRKRQFKTLADGVLGLAEALKDEA